MPPAAKYGNDKGSLPPGVDVRGHGGYIVLPPSVHPSGNLYRWEIGYGPHEIEARALPAGLKEMLDDGAAHQRIIGPPDKYAVAIATKLVESILIALDLATFPVQVYDGSGRKWILKSCPFNPETDPHENDKAAFIFVYSDGHISAGCSHERCRNRLAAAKSRRMRFIVGQRPQPTRT